RTPGPGAALRQTARAAVEWRRARHLDLIDPRSTAVARDLDDHEVERVRTDRSGPDANEVHVLDLRLIHAESPELRFGARLDGDDAVDGIRPVLLNRGGALEDFDGVDGCRIQSVGRAHAHAVDDVDRLFISIGRRHFERPAHDDRVT